MSSALLLERQPAGGSADLTLPPPADRPLDQNPAAAYLASLARGSRRTMRQALELVARSIAPSATATSFAWEKLRYQHVAALRTKLADAFAPATGNKILCAVRGAMRQAFALGLMDANDLQRAIAIKPIRGSRVQKGREVSQAELAKVFAVCDPTTSSGARDAALLALAYGTGLRRSELTAADVSDYDRAEGALLVHGKGNKERTVYVAGETKGALDHWLLVRPQIPGPLFLPVTKTGSLQPRRMSDQAVYLILVRVARRAGVAAFSPHDLRRTYVGDMLDAGADISTVQGLVGHASVVTTQRYDRRGERAKRAAAALLKIPRNRPLST
jgi:site-specific recombinase XerD